jgi:hypothetical protein
MPFLSGISSAFGVALSAFAEKARTDAASATALITIFFITSPIQFFDKVAFTEEASVLNV